MVKLPPTRSVVRTLQTPLTPEGRQRNCHIGSHKKRINCFYSLHYELVVEIMVTVKRTNMYLQHMYKHRSVERGLETKDKGSAFDEVEEFAIGFPVGFPHPSRFNSFF